MLERIKAAVEAVEKVRTNKRFVREHLDVWDPLEYTWTVKPSDWPVEPYTPVWSGSEDGTMVADTWHRVVYYAQPIYKCSDISLDTGEFYDTDMYTYTHTNIDMPVW